MVDNKQSQFDDDFLSFEEECCQHKKLHLVAQTGDKKSDEPLEGYKIELIKQVLHMSNHFRKGGPENMLEDFLINHNADHARIVVEW